MRKELFESFEKALRQRNPILADRLEPGLPESRVRRMLQRAKVEGATERVVELFAWKNGTRIDPSVARHASPFPFSDYIFMDLEMMIVDFQGFSEGALYHARMTQLVGRYFPIFWDGSNGWIATDLRPSQCNRVVLVDAQAERPVRPAYDSFDQFLKDAIRANEQGDKLTCFK
jgi:hypothetical protein